jgi:hypothetical protein
MHAVNVVARDEVRVRTRRDGLGECRYPAVEGRDTGNTGAQARLFELSEELTGFALAL